MVKVALSSHSITEFYKLFPFFLPGLSHVRMLNVSLVVTGSPYMQGGRICVYGYVPYGYI